MKNRKLRPDSTNFAFSERFFARVARFSVMAALIVVSSAFAAPGTPVVTDDGDFTTSASQLHATWVAADDGTGITEYQYAVGTTSGGTEALDWTTSGAAAAATITGLSLSDGATYYISVKAKNTAGDWSAAGASDGITVDSTAPTCQVLELSALIGETTFSVYWSAADAGSGLADLYDVQVMDSVDGSWTDWLSNSRVTSAQFEGLDGHTYYFQCRAKDEAGNWTAYADGFGDTSATISIETITISDLNDGVGADIDYSSDATSISANWSVAPGAVAYMYAVGTSPGDDDVVAWTRAQTNSFTESGLFLLHDTVYYVSVSPVTSAEYVGEAASSDGVLIDQTAPEDPDVQVVDSQINSTTEIQAYWSSVDSETGIADYTVSIGTAQGMTDIMSATSVGLDEERTFTGLSLTNGTTYFINVTATNNVGLVSSTQSSSGVTVVSTILPEPDSVYDGVGADIEYTSSATTLSANWTAVAGAASYEYAVGTAPGGSDLKTWTSAGATTSVTDATLTLTHGATYYVSVRALDAGSVPGASTSSDGVTVDTTVPSVPIIEDQGLLTENATTLSASWISEEPESGITLYEYAVGTTATTQDVMGWTSAGTNESVTISSLALQIGGTYFIQVRATNGAGLVSVAGVSNGITRVNPASVSIVAQPANITTAINADGTAHIQLSLTHTETNGVSVSYYQVQRFYILDNGTDFEDPVETTSLQLDGVLTHDLNFDIPVEVVTHSLGGRAQSSMTLRLIFTGHDSSNNEVTTKIDVDVTLTGHTVPSAVTIGAINITSPAANAVLRKDDTNTAVCTIAVTGSGTIKGYWEIDGRPHRDFQTNAASSNEVSQSMVIPSSLGGVHTLKLKIIMPEVAESAPVTFTVQGERLVQESLTDFWAGPLQFTSVQAVLDADNDAYSGSAVLKYKNLTFPKRVPFKGFLLTNVDGKYQLTGGALATEAPLSITKDAVTVEIERLKVTVDKVVADGQVHFEGTDTIPGIGPIKFYSVTVTADSISGKVSFPEPQRGSIGIFDIAIDSVDFSYDGADLDLTASGWIKSTLPDVNFTLHAAVMITSDAAVFALGESASNGSASSDINNDINIAGVNYHVNNGSLAITQGALSLSSSGIMTLSVSDNIVPGGNGLDLNFSDFTITSDGTITGVITP